jgi:hypothetical protein
MAFGDADLNMMMADAFSVAITYGAQTATGFLNRSGSYTDADSGVTYNLNTTTLVIQTGDLTSLALEAAITVDSGSYLISGWTPEADGKETHILIRPA